MSAFHDFAKTAALVGSMAAGLLAAQAASAKEKPVFVYGDPTSIRTERVSFADLDLTARSDARRLHLKVAGAVKRVCLFDDNRAKLQPSDYYSCADGAWDRARPQIDRALSNAVAMNGAGARTAVAVITVSAFGS